MTCRHERDDYRMRRAWPGWIIERRWGCGWIRIGGRMSHTNAHGVLQELHDWHWVTASSDAQAIMRAEIRRLVP